MNSTPSTEEGSRYNEGKLPIGLVPPEAIKGLTAVLAFGAQKYAPRNWEKGLSWTETYESLQRHILAWLQDSVRLREPCPVIRRGLGKFLARYIHNRFLDNLGKSDKT